MGNIDTNELTVRLEAKGLPDIILTPDGAEYHLAALEEPLPSRVVISLEKENYRAYAIWRELYDAANAEDGDGPYSGIIEDTAAFVEQAKQAGEQKYQETGSGIDAGSFVEEQYYNKLLRSEKLRLASEDGVTNPVAIAAYTVKAGQTDVCRELDKYMSSLKLRKNAAPAENTLLAAANAAKGDEVEKTEDIAISADKICRETTEALKEAETAAEVEALITTTNEALADSVQAIIAEEAAGSAGEDVVLSKVIGNMSDAELEEIINTAMPSLGELKDESDRKVAETGAQAAILDQAEFAQQQAAIANATSSEEQNTLADNLCTSIVEQIIDAQDSQVVNQLKSKGTTAEVAGMHDDDVESDEQCGISDLLKLEDAMKYFRGNRANSIEFLQKAFMLGGLTNDISQWNIKRDLRKLSDVELMALVRFCVCDVDGTIYMNRRRITTLVEILRICNFSLFGATGIQEAILSTRPGLIAFFSKIKNWQQACNINFATSPYDDVVFLSLKSEQGEVVQSIELWGTLNETLLDSLADKTGAIEQFIAWSLPIRLSDTDLRMRYVYSYDALSERSKCNRGIYIAYGEPGDDKIYDAMIMCGMNGWRRWDQKLSSILLDTLRANEWFTDAKRDQFIRSTPFARKYVRDDRMNILGMDAMVNTSDVNAIGVDVNEVMGDMNAQIEQNDVEQIEQKGDETNE